MVLVAWYLLLGTKWLVLGTWYSVLVTGTWYLGCYPPHWSPCVVWHDQKLVFTYMVLVTWYLMFGTRYLILAACYLVLDTWDILSNKYFVHIRCLLLDTCYLELNGWCSVLDTWNLVVDTWYLVVGMLATPLITVCRVATSVTSHFVVTWN